MNLYIQLITIVIPIFIQQTTQVSVMRYNADTLPLLGPKHSRLENAEPAKTDIRHIPLNKKKLSNKTSKKKLSDEKVTVNGKLIDNNTKSKLSERTDDDETYIEFDDIRNENVIKYDNKDKRVEYDAYGKRYYRVAMEDNGNGVKYDMYEDDSGTRYYKVYVIDDRSGYVVINGVRYHRIPEKRPGKKQSLKKKVPLNQQIYVWTPRLGKRSVGRPKARWSDDSRNTQAEDRSQWRAMERPMSSSVRIWAADDDEGS